MAYVDFKTKVCLYISPFLLQSMPCFYLPLIINGSTFTNSLFCFISYPNLEQMLFYKYYALGIYLMVF